MALDAARIPGYLCTQAPVKGATNENGSNSLSFLPGASQSDSAWRFRAGDIRDAGL